MSGILDHILEARQFSPTDLNEYLALQLAKRLGDERDLKRYIRYCEQHPPDHLLQLFNEIILTSNPAEAFHSSLATEP